VVEKIFTPSPPPIFFKEEKELERTSVSFSTWHAHQSKYRAATMAPPFSFPVTSPAVNTKRTIDWHSLRPIYGGEWRRRAAASSFLLSISMPSIDKRGRYILCSSPFFFFFFWAPSPLLAISFFFLHLLPVKDQARKK